MASLPYSASSLRWLLIAALFAGSATGIGAVAYLVLVPRNYEECLVSEMRGQPAGMEYQVTNLCSRRFHKEMNIPATDFKINWSDDQNGVTVFVESPGVEITKGEFSFASKDCANAKFADFTVVKSGAARNNQFVFSEEFDPAPICMRTDSIRGRYK